MNRWRGVAVAESHSQTFEVLAGSQDEAIAMAASESGIDPMKLTVLAEDPQKRLPWQPKRSRYTLGLAAPPAQEDRDGFWTVKFENGEVWLTVTPPTGDGNPVRLDSLLAAAHDWPAESINQTDLWPVLQRASAEPETVSHYEVPEHAPFRIEVAPSDMAVYVICGAEPPEEGAEKIVGALQQAGVTRGIDPESIDALLQAWDPDAAVLVAQGLPPVDGADSVISRKFSAEGSAPELREDGTVDFFASQLTTPVVKDEPVAIKEPATDGMEGYTVRGEVLPAQHGKDLDLRRLVGQGVALSGDGLQLVATAEGTPSFAGGKYSVLPTLRIDQDVSFGTGNIDFPGNVLIAGDVQDGFSVRADGDITVKGVVQGASLEASGQIVLLAGMFGRERGTLKAAGDVRAQFLHECTVTSDADVLVGGELVRATVTARGSVHVTGAGKIMGGTISAGREVMANAVGSPVGRVATRIVLSPPVAEEGTPPTRAPRPALKVRGITYPPTQIVIGDARRTIDSEIAYAIFTERDGAVSMTPYT